MKAQHVSEDGLVAMATIGDADDAARAHVSACADCAARLHELSLLLDDVRGCAVDEADEVFDLERLDRQRDHVLRRIENPGRPGRIIEFPHRAGRATRPMSPFAARWVAAAAAAGLVIGVYAGSHMTTGGPGTIADTSLTRIAAPAAQTAQETVAPRDVQASRSDDDILFEVETALVTQRAPALVAIDALTPRVSEIGLRIR